MAPTPKNTTARVKAFYTGPLGTHTMLLHGVTGVTPAAIASAFLPVATAMLALMYSGAQFTGAEYAEAGSNLFFPLAWVSPGTGGGPPPTATSSPGRFLQFGGRSNTTGKRVKLFLFETFATARQKMRYTLAESAEVAAIVNALVASAGQIGAIDGTSPLWYQYANVSDNDYITHRARRS